MDEKVEGMEGFEEQIAAELHAVAENYGDHPRELIVELGMLLGVCIAQYSKTKGKPVGRWELIKRFIWVSKLTWDSAWLMRAYLKEERERNERQSNLD